jgi:hypothetical protein
MGFDPMPSNKGIGMEAIQMTNVTMVTDENDVLTITVDLKQRHGRSASGKTIMIASTQGNAEVEGHETIKVGLNVYTK